ncbi:PREDICTED: uncharacterized protein LOC102846737 [Elephantulus edwardii]|uniref:uncharacterized protein LOC102846737 n=1 Tax=Elephantulus edwardii TaxID=28737 RepID=UPI0003F0DC5B|nr:PREDICTED: uncharacterized protein LOC102846737 [Elephantulus edwardii]
MLRSNFLKVVMTLMCPGFNIAQKVTQDQPAVMAQEKEAVTLHCTYDTNEVRFALLWYKQPSSGQMIFLVRQESYNEQNATESRYSLNFQKAAKSIDLVISASQLEDSAMYFCALRGDTVREERFSLTQKVNKIQLEMMVQEEETVTLNCTYDTSDPSFALFWYKQSSSGQIIFLIRQESYQQNATDGRYSLNFQQTSKSINLAISASQLGDSAVLPTTCVVCELSHRILDPANQYDCCEMSSKKYGSMGDMSDLMGVGFLLLILLKRIVSLCEARKANEKEQKVIAEHEISFDTLDSPQKLKNFSTFRQALHKANI